MNGPASADLASLQRQLQLYEQLLDMGTIDDPEALLRNALEVAVEHVGAAKGYLALFAPGAPVGTPPRWWAQVGCSGQERQAVEGELSRTIMRDTLAGSMLASRGLLQPHQVVRILAAQGHPKYQGQHSVQLKNIKSVLAVPVGRVARGVLYLQDRAAGGVFRLEDERFLQRFVQHLGPFVDRVVLREASSGALDRELTGTSDAIRQLRTTVRWLAAAADLPVCVWGPAGSGRTTLARALHRHGLRARGPLIEQACGAWPTSVAVDELFGVEGDAPVPALVGAAEGGTLVLEDIDALPLEAQAAVAAWLDARAYRPRGAPAARDSSVRLIATTRVDLEAAVAAGVFRADLFARLQAGRVRVPGLSERLEDLPELIETLGRAACTEAGLPWMEVTPSAILEATRRPWRGHIVELSAVLTRAIVQADGTRRLDVVDLFPSRPDAPPRDAPREDGALFDADRPLIAWKEWKHDVMGRYLRHALGRHGGAREATWRALRLSRAQGYSLLAEHGLDGED